MSIKYYRLWRIVEYRVTCWPIDFHSWESRKPSPWPNSLTAFCVTRCKSWNKSKKDLSFFIHVLIWIKQFFFILVFQIEFTFTFLVFNVLVNLLEIRCKSRPIFLEKIISREVYVLCTDRERPILPEETIKISLLLLLWQQ